MKKLILSLALVAGATAAAQAQSGVTYGLKAGASLTTYAGDDASGLSSKFGFHGGLVANFGLTDMFSVQPELLFSMKGAQDSGNSSNKLNTSYIDVPILAKVSTGATGLFFELGPQIGFLASATNKTSGSSYDIKDSFNSVDFGYAAGLGFKVESGPMIGLRYNGGFSNCLKSVAGYDPKVRNSAFQLYVGYMFGGK